jgi:hypothetical protein
MDAETFSDEELEYFKRMCEASEQTGFDWPLAVSIFPAETDEEKRWKERVLRGILLCKSAGDRDPSRFILERFSHGSDGRR